MSLPLPLLESKLCAVIAREHLTSLVTARHSPMAWCHALSRVSPCPWIPSGQSTCRSPSFLSRGHAAEAQIAGVSLPEQDGLQKLPHLSVSPMLAEEVTRIAFTGWVVEGYHV